MALNDFYAEKKFKFLVPHLIATTREKFICFGGDRTSITGFVGGRSSTALAGPAQNSHMQYIKITEKLWPLSYENKPPELIATINDTMEKLQIKEFN